MTTKQVCGNRRCGWHGSSDDVLIAPSPFYPTDILWACPWCKVVNETYTACDEPDCWEPATCGTPTQSGYRSTCGKHIPEPPA